MPAPIKGKDQNRLPKQQHRHHQSSSSSTTSKPKSNKPYARPSVPSVSSSSSSKSSRPIVLPTLAAGSDDDDDDDDEEEDEEDEEDEEEETNDNSEVDLDQSDDEILYPEETKAATEKNNRQGKDNMAAYRKRKNKEFAKAAQDIYNVLKKGADDKPSKMNLTITGELLGSAAFRMPARHKDFEKIERADDALAKLSERKITWPQARPILLQAISALPSIFESI